MHTFDNTDLVRFKFNMADIHNTLHIPTNDTPFTTKKPLEMIVELFPSNLGGFKEREGWQLIKVPENIL